MATTVSDENSASRVCSSALKRFQCITPVPECTHMFDTSTFLSDARLNDSIDDGLGCVLLNSTSTLSHPDQQSSEYVSTSSLNDSLPTKMIIRRRVDHVRHLRSVVKPTGSRVRFIRTNTNQATTM